MSELSFDTSKSVERTDGKQIYGVTIDSENIQKAIDELDFSVLKASNVENPYIKGFHPQLIRPGCVVYLQKGRNERMKNPYVVKEVDFDRGNPPKITVVLEPTLDRSYETTLYAQLDPRKTESLISLHSDAEYVSARDRSMGSLYDNGNIWAIPDQEIVDKLKDKIELDENAAAFLL